MAETRGLGRGGAESEIGRREMRWVLEGLYEFEGNTGLTKERRRGGNCETGTTRVGYVLIVTSDSLNFCDT